MRAGETARLSTSVLPPDAAQEVTVTVANPEIITAATAETSQGA